MAKSLKRTLKNKARRRKFSRRKTVKPVRKTGKKLAKTRAKRKNMSRRRPNVKNGTIRRRQKRGGRKTMKKGGIKLNPTANEKKINKLIKNFKKLKTSTKDPVGIKGVQDEIKKQMTAYENKEKHNSLDGSDKKIIENKKQYIIDISNDNLGTLEKKINKRVRTIENIQNNANIKTQLTNNTSNNLSNIKFSDSNISYNDISGVCDISGIDCSNRSLPQNLNLEQVYNGMDEEYNSYQNELDTFKNKIDISYNIKKRIINKNQDFKNKNRKNSALQTKLENKLREFQDISGIIDVSLSTYIVEKNKTQNLVLGTDICNNDHTIKFNPKDSSSNYLEFKKVDASMKFEVTDVSNVGDITNSYYVQYKFEDKTGTKIKKGASTVGSAARKGASTVGKRFKASKTKTQKNSNTSNKTQTNNPNKKYIEIKMEIPDDVDLQLAKNTSDSVAKTLEKYIQSLGQENKDGRQGEGDGPETTAPDTAAQAASSIAPAQASSTSPAPASTPAPASDTAQAAQRTATVAVVSPGSTPASSTAPAASPASQAQGTATGTAPTQGADTASRTQHREGDEEGKKLIDSHSR